MVEEANGIDVKVGDEVEVKDEVELGEPPVRLVDCAPIEGTKGIPAPLGAPHSQS